MRGLIFVNSMFFSRSVSEGDSCQNFGRCFAFFGGADCTFQFANNNFIDRFLSFAAPKGSFGTFGNWHGGSIIEPKLKWKT